MDSSFFRKYADIIHAAHIKQLKEDVDGAPVSQAELANLYKQGKPVHFLKNTPVALVPFQQLEKLLGNEAADKIKQLAGTVDQTTYDQAYKDNGYVVFQWNSKDKSPDIYIANPNVVKSKYVKFTGQLPSDAKSRGKIPSLVVLQHLNIDPSRMPFYVKVVPVEMVHVDDLGLAGKPIQTNWGEQTVQAGGYLVREENGHIYTVAPDAQGLPIGYVKASMSEATVRKATPPPRNPMQVPATDPYWDDVKVTGGRRSGGYWKVTVERNGEKWGWQTLSAQLPSSLSPGDFVRGLITIQQDVGTKREKHYSFQLKLSDPNHPLVKKCWEWIEQNENKPEPPVDFSTSSWYNR